MSDSHLLPDSGKKTIAGRFSKLINKIRSFANYCISGVWSDPTNSWRVNLVKIANLTVNSVLNPNFQNLAAAMTYRTILSLVPVLALLFAICRGFGFQNILSTQLHNFFPSQEKVIDTALQFVDSYLAQASEGIFVGVGILFLLWTVISLLSSLEDSFNTIWMVKEGRTIWRKATDYLCIFIMLPILLICSNGITIVLETTLRNLLDGFLTPALSIIFEVVSFLLSCLVFTLIYLLIPNTKVKFKYACYSGLLVGVAYNVLQWLFVSGQLYVAKYNAIYGSFSFLPLMLIWLQLVWLFTFVGAEICYASQNFYRFNYHNHIAEISLDYRLRVDVAIAVIIAQRFINGKHALNAEQLSRLYNIPYLLTEDAINKLIQCGLIVRIVDADGENEESVAPSRDVSAMTLGDVIHALYTRGDNNFIPNFSSEFKGVTKVMNSVSEAMIRNADSILLSSIDLGQQSEIG